MKVSDEAIAALRRDAEGFDGVIIAVLDELMALRKVADATVAFMNAPYSNDEKELNELGDALTEAGL